MNTIKKNQTKQQTLRTSYKPFCWEVFINCEMFMYNSNPKELEDLFPRIYYQIDTK